MKQYYKFQLMQFSSEMDMSKALDEALIYFSKKFSTTNNPNPRPKKILVNPNTKETSYKEIVLIKDRTMYVKNMFGLVID